MYKLIFGALLTFFACTSYAQAIKPGSYFVKESFLEERLEPSASGTVTNKIYRMQKVKVFEINGEWARVSKYYNGISEGKSGQVARWVKANGLSSSKPAELMQPKIPSDPRIAKDAFPEVGSSSVTEEDLRIIYKGAIQNLNNGKCSKVEYGDKSTTKKDTYYINCGGPNIFFTPSELN
jgi:hypothetical protein